MPPGLFHNTIPCIDDDQRHVRRRRAGDHVPGVLNVSGRVGEDEFAFGRGEVTVRHVDRDALFTLCPQAVR